MRIILTLILFISQISFTFARDKALSEQYSQITESYSAKIKSQDPDKVVVFISSRINTDYLDVVEVDFDSSDLTDGIIEINRPLNSPKSRSINECKLETGNVTIQPSKLIISVNSFPFRLICYGDNGNYREAYSTFKQ